MTLLEFEVTDEKLDSNQQERSLVGPPAHKVHHVLSLLRLPPPQLLHRDCLLDGHAAPAAAANSLRPLRRWCRPRLHTASHRPRRRRVPGPHGLRRSQHHPARVPQAHRRWLAAAETLRSESSGFLLCW